MWMKASAGNLHELHGRESLGAIRSESVCELPHVAVCNWLLPGATA